MAFFDVNTVSFKLVPSITLVPYILYPSSFNLGNISFNSSTIIFKLYIIPSVALITLELYKYTHLGLSIKVSILNATTLLIIVPILPGSLISSNTSTFPFIVPLSITLDTPTIFVLVSKLDILFITALLTNMAFGYLEVSPSKTYTSSKYPFLYASSIKCLPSIKNLPFSFMYFLSFILINSFTFSLLTDSIILTLL